MGRLADCPIKLGNRLGQPTRRIEVTRRMLGLSGEYFMPAPSLQTPLKRTKFKEFNAYNYLYIL